MAEAHDWDRVLALYSKLERGEALSFDADVSGLCRQVARDVAVDEDDLEEALRTDWGAENLVRELRRRIFEGSRRLSRALADSARFKNEGDVARARSTLESVLAVEKVPLYREQAEIALSHVDEPEEP